ncbi:Thiol:disulfide oxidoreductase related to ResA [hydrothermal vent metagenome]|uniref:Thiol:disulfide oxidoreductase related to ResA n=1 Tax=hydrothermal vent metagenome TaxID=652676 RepID=A0A3B1ANI9_9ZZZZ
MKLQPHIKYGNFMQSIKPLIQSILLLLSVFILNACNRNEFIAGKAFPMSTLQQLMTQNNKTIDIKAKFLLINFWATWCIPCRKEMPDLQNLSEQLDKNKFIIIGISVDEDKNLMQEFLLQHKIYFSNLNDPKQILAMKKLNIQAYPETFVISPDGIIIKRLTGYHRWSSNKQITILKSLYLNKKELSTYKMDTNVDEKI